MKSRKKGIAIALAVILVLGVVIAMIILQSQGKFASGNDAQYSASSCEVNDNSPIKDKTIIFLGSSVTYGATSGQESFVDYMQRIDGINPIKEAVSGTTLVDNGDSSYVARMKALDKNIKADAFVCQLSTNDATKKKPFGEISSSFDMNDFDTATVAGAIEYIIAYAKETYNCPVYFYTGTQYNSSQYQKMVDLLLQIADKWDIEVLDLWNDPDMNAVSKDDYKLYMVNGIHPSKAGYKLWWTPKFQEFLYKEIG